MVGTGLVGVVGVVYAGGGTVGVEHSYSLFGRFAVAVLVAVLGVGVLGAGCFASLLVITLSAASVYTRPNLARGTSAISVPSLSFPPVLERLTLP